MEKVVEIHGKRARWTMPRHLKKYKKLILNTVGTPVEELMNDHKTDAHVSLFRYTQIVTVDAQIALLEKLYKLGYLRENVYDGRVKSTLENRNNK